MPSYTPPKRATEYIFYVCLVSQSNTKLFQNNPTIAAGDFQVSKDGGTFANLATLPAVTPTSSRSVKITLSSTEMTADNVLVRAVDAAGAEWCDAAWLIQPSVRQLDDLAYPATSGRSLAVDTNGRIDVGSVLGTAQTAGDIMASVGAVGATAGTGDPNSSKSVMQYIKQVVNLLIGSAGPATFPASADPANGVNLFKVARAIWDGIALPKKNTALNDVPFIMFDATTKQPKTGVTVTLTRSIDGGAYAAKDAGTTVAEVGSGTYQVDLAAADTNGNIITYRATGAGCDDTFFTIRYRN